MLETADEDPPWPVATISSRFGNSRDRTALTKVNPTVVAKVGQFHAAGRGVATHPLRFLRYRAELHAEGLP